MGRPSKLTSKQARFIDEYMIDLNATQACIRAGYSSRTADRIGPELLGKTCVQSALSVRMKDREKRTEITQDKVLREFAKLAFFDPRKLFDADGKPLPIHQLDDDTAAVVAGLDVASVGNSDMGIGEVLKIKLADKKGALDSVARHLGMFNDKLSVTHSFSEMTDEEIKAEIAQLNGHT